MNSKLADYLKSLDGETRVVMEHTGRYYEQIALYLHDAGIYVSAVNPKPIKDYGSGNSLRHVKTDKAEPRKLPSLLLTDGRNCGNIHPRTRFVIN